ncbi:hypothetical protein Hanom_Chr06g00481321 [Helianthus anomalus]
MELTSWMKMARFQPFEYKCEKTNVWTEVAKVAKPQGQKGHFTQKLIQPYVFLHRICVFLFPDVGGGSLDSRHGYVLQYGKDKAIKEDLHVDDSEVTLHVCLGNQFAGGELVFGGQRCKDHVNGGTHIKKVHTCIYV